MDLESKQKEQMDSKASNPMEDPHLSLRKQATTACSTKESTPASQLLGKVPQDLPDYSGRATCMPKESSSDARHHISGGH